ncbi:MAG: GtrA family protein [Thermoplasmata archaeon]
MEPTSPAATQKPSTFKPSRAVLRYAKFLLVGVTGFVVNLIVFTLVLDALLPGPSSGFFASVARFLTETSGNPTDNLIASSFAFVVATLWNFLWNNAWTFRAQVGHRHPLHRRVPLYYLVALGALGLNEAVLFLLSGSLPPLYGQGLGILAGSIVGYFGNARYTFAETDEETADGADQRPRSIRP